MFIKLTEVFDGTSRKIWVNFLIVRYFCERKAGSEGSFICFGETDKDSQYVEVAENPSEILTILKNV